MTGRHLAIRVQHVVERGEIDRVFGTGKEIAGLCGAKFAPMAEGDWKVPACKDCISLMGDGDTLTPYRKKPKVTWTYTVQTSWEPRL